MRDPIKYIVDYVEFREQLDETQWLDLQNNIPEPIVDMSTVRYKDDTDFTGAVHMHPDQHAFGKTPTESQKREQKLCRKECGMSW